MHRAVFMRFSEVGNFQVSSMGAAEQPAIR
jgi:hypothetical protein